jgi:hypothetical protein
MSLSARPSASPDRESDGQIVDQHRWSFGAQEDALEYGASNLVSFDGLRRSRRDSKALIKL